MSESARGPNPQGRGPGNRCRVLTEPPADGAWNMAVDDVLLDSAVQRGVGSLRFYRWQEPTLSLGYFQRWRQRQSHAPSGACPLVRRPSGGGAILHDDELTYSIVVPPGHRLVSGARELYRAIHQALIAALAQLGVMAEMFEASAAAVEQTEAFLCFQRRAIGDVLCSGAKVAGSAQRRRHGAVMQHGSILLGRSAAAPELPGVEQASGVRIAPEQLATFLRQALDARLAMELYDDGLSSDEGEQANRLKRIKYDHDDWTLRS